MDDKSFIKYSVFIVVIFAVVGVLNIFLSNGFLSDSSIAGFAVYGGLEGMGETEGMNGISGMVSWASVIMNKYTPLHVADRLRNAQASAGPTRNMAPLADAPTIPSCTDSDRTSLDNQLYSSGNSIHYDVRGTVRGYDENLEHFTHTDTCTSPTGGIEYYCIPHVPETGIPPHEGDNAIHSSVNFECTLDMPYCRNGRCTV